MVVWYCRALVLHPADEAESGFGSVTVRGGDTPRFIQ
jgi:hypothetical protein